MKSSHVVNFVEKEQEKLLYLIHFSPLNNIFGETSVTA